MKLKVTMFLGAAVFVGACDGFGSLKKEEAVKQTKGTNITTVKSDNGQDTTVILERDGERVESSKDGFVVTSKGKREVISKEGFSVEEGENLKLTTSGVTKTISCNGRTVTIGGTNNKYTFTGECSQVILAGVNQKVSVEKVGFIKVDGIDNRLEYGEGITGQKPEIVAGGINTSVAKK